MGENLISTHWAWRWSKSQYNKWSKKRRLQTLNPSKSKQQYLSGMLSSPWGQKLLALAFASNAKLTLRNWQWLCAVRTNTHHHHHVRLLKVVICNQTYKHNWKPKNLLIISEFFTTHLLTHH